jgi:hypothetical protein
MPSRQIVHRRFRGTYCLYLRCRRIIQQKSNTKEICFLGLTLNPKDRNYIPPKLRLTSIGFHDDAYEDIRSPLWRPTFEKCHLQVNVKGKGISLKLCSNKTWECSSSDFLTMNYVNQNFKSVCKPGRLFAGSVERLKLHVKDSDLSSDLLISKSTVHFL